MTYIKDYRRKTRGFEQNMQPLLNKALANDKDDLYSKEL